MKVVRKKQGKADFNYNHLSGVIQVGKDYFRCFPEEFIRRLSLIANVVDCDKLRMCICCELLLEYGLDWLEDDLRDINGVKEIPLKFNNWHTEYCYIGRLPSEQKWNITDDLAISKAIDFCILNSEYNTWG